MRERREAVFRVEPVRVARREHETADALQIRMREHELDEALAELAAARVGDDEDVGEPRETRAVRDHARECELARSVEDREAERRFDRALDELAPDARNPVRLGREKRVNRVDVQPAAIRGE